MSALYIQSDFVSKVAEWSSILGFFIGIATLIIAGTVKRAIQEANKKVLVNQKLNEDLARLSNLNSSFIDLIQLNRSNNEATYNLLSKIYSQVQIINRYVPKDFSRQGKRLLKRISSQRRHSERGCSLWDIYRDSVGYVDVLSSYSKEKEIIS